MYKLTKLDAALQRCNIRISNYVSTTKGKAYQDVVRLISEGKTDPEELVKHIHGPTVNRVGKDILIRALSGVVTAADIDTTAPLITLIIS